MKVPEFDEDGYPTEDTLNAIRIWPAMSAKNLNDLLNFVAQTWHFKDFGVSEELRPEELKMVSGIEPNAEYLRLATGGWSGNESLIDALHDNTVAWMCLWRLSACGGLHIFRYMEVNR